PLLTQALVAEMEAAKEEAPAPASVPDVTGAGGGGEAGSTGGTGGQGTVGTATIDRRKLLDLEERFTAPTAGEGIKRIEELLPGATTDRAKSEVLAASLAVPEMDRLAASLPEKELAVFAAALDEAAATGDPARVREEVQRASTAAAAKGSALAGGTLDRGSAAVSAKPGVAAASKRSEEHTSELQ